MKLLELELYTWYGMLDVCVGKESERVSLSIINPINISSVVKCCDGWSKMNMIGHAHDDLISFCYVHMEIKELKSMIEEAMDDIIIEDLDKFSWRDYVITNGRKK